MANKNLFKSQIGKLMPATDAINQERAPGEHGFHQYLVVANLFLVVCWRNVRSQFRIETHLHKRQPG